MKLLIAEDDIDLSEALSVFFKKNGFAVDCVHNGFDAYDYAIEGNYDAIILDIMMPKLDGLSVLERLRSDGCETQIMMLTAKAEKIDRIEGFNRGADDYLPKPFATDELLARVKAMLRRNAPYQPTVLSCGDLELNTNDGSLKCREKCVYLGVKDLKICELFMRTPGIVYSADTILEKVWGWESGVDRNVVWVYISNIRKTLGYLKSTTKIKTSRGLGYFLETQS